MLEKHRFLYLYVCHFRVAAARGSQPLILHLGNPTCLNACWLLHQLYEIFGYMRLSDANWKEAMGLGMTGGVPGVAAGDAGLLNSLACARIV